MDIIKVILMSIFSIIELFLLTKVIGNRQMSELNMFDYVNGITIGSIAAEMATSLEDDIKAPAIAMAVYALFTVLISYISSRSVKARRILVGTSIILFKNDTLYKQNLKTAKIDINELITQLRINGYFDLSQIDTVILEENGKISILPKAEYNFVTPKDLSLKVNSEHPQPSIIIDGKILKNNLKFIGKDEQWVKKQLKAQKISDIYDVFYACFNPKSDLLLAFKKYDKKESSDIFI